MARDTSPGAKRKKESGAPSIFGLVNDPNALSIRLHTSGTGVEIEMTQCHPAHQREQHSARSGQRPRRRTPLSVSWCCLAFATLENSNALSIRVHLPGGLELKRRRYCGHHVISTSAVPVSSVVSASVASGPISAAGTGATVMGAAAARSISQ